ncbi:MAG: Dihydrofolate reductase, partial [uncultured Thermomicrobiales bacterium]
GQGHRRGDGVAGRLHRPAGRHGRAAVRLVRHRRDRGPPAGRRLAVEGVARQRRPPPGTAGDDRCVGDRAAHVRHHRRLRRPAPVRRAGLRRHPRGAPELGASGRPVHLRHRGRRARRRPGQGDRRRQERGGRDGQLGPAMSPGGAAGRNRDRPGAGLARRWGPLPGCARRRPDPAGTDPNRRGVRCHAPAVPGRAI